MFHFKATQFVVLALLISSQVLAQTCKTESIPATTPSSRFKDNGNGTVSDTKTGLMWKKCSEGQSGSDCRSGSATGYTWQQALQQAQTVNQSGFAGYKDWRVPNVNELNSILEEQCYEPAVNLSIFPNTPSSSYWSSSSYADSSNGAWSVLFESGYTNGSLKDDGHYVRLVR